MKDRILIRKMQQLEGILNVVLNGMKDFEDANQEANDLYSEIGRNLTDEELEIYKSIKDKLESVGHILKDYV